MKDLGELFKNKNFLIKLIALIILIIVVIFWGAGLDAYGDLTGNFLARTYEWVVVATATYVLILLVFIVVYVCEDTIRSFELWFMGCGCILNIIGGILQLVCAISSSGNFATFVVAVLMIVAGILMGLDIFLQIK